LVGIKIFLNIFKIKIENRKTVFHDGIEYDRILRGTTGVEGVWVPRCTPTLKFLAPVLKL
jgi:hypothetical protein